MADITYIPIRQLYPHPDNPRKELGDLTELAASIKENGVYQNLTVIPGHYLGKQEYIARCIADGGDASAAEAAWTPKAVWSSEDYTIIIGHRRAAAAQQAGKFELPCSVVDMTEKEQLQTMMVENMQRSDLTVYEQAQGFQMMLDMGDTVERVADRSGFSQSTIRRRIKLLELNHDNFKRQSSVAQPFPILLNLTKSRTWMPGTRCWKPSVPRTSTAPCRMPCLTRNTSIERLNGLSSFANLLWKIPMPITVLTHTLPGTDIGTLARTLKCRTMPIA